MAASLGRSARVTLTTKQLLSFDVNRKAFSTCKICCGNTWHVFGKETRTKEHYNAPKVDGKFAGKGNLASINIPDKIERSPTSILEALASTVNNNLNQPIYKSIDDPYLYVNSDRQKTNLLAAMDSGSKAAQLMISMYPDYFTQLWREPLPDCYRDQHLGYKVIDLSEEALLERIEKLSIKDAVSVYKELMASKKYPSQKTQEKLLEFLTLFNCESYEPESDLSTFVNMAPLHKHTPFPRVTWKKGNIAEEVFNSLPEKTSKAYCYMIRGMASNFNKQEALKMYNEMKVTNLSVDVFTYNLLLTLASIEVESLDDIKNYVEIILRDMASNNVKPNAETFNSVLANCTRISRWSGTRDYALSVLSEMKACGIEPTPATFDEILRIFYYHNDKTSTPVVFLEQILNEIQGKEYKCTTETDVSFFRTAMKVISKHFPDSVHALKLHKSLKTGNNMDFLGHRWLQYSYYQDMFLVITPLEHIDVVMDLYTSVVPFIFSPSSDIYILIFESIQMYDAYHYLPQLCADLQLSFFFSNQEFVDILARQLSQKKHDPKLQGQLCDIATSLLNKWQETRSRASNRQSYMDGSILGHFIITFLNNDQPQKAWQCFQLYVENTNLQNMDPSEESLSRLAEHTIAEENYISTKKILDLMNKLHYDGVSPVVEKSLQTFELSDDERNYLKSLAIISGPSTD